MNVSYDFLPQYPVCVLSRTSLGEHSGMKIWIDLPVVNLQYTRVLLPKLKLSRIPLLGIRVV
jgi:hypothetical protein